MSTEEFEWDEFISLGNQYLKDSEPVKQRTGISRFYYGTFCSTRDYINREKTYLGEKSEEIMTSKSADVHNQTSKIFKCHEKFKNNNQGKIISKNLNKLRKMRNKADYDKVIDKSLNKMINESKILSERILEMLDQLN